jgi:hypothetical protein
MHVLPGLEHRAGQEREVEPAPRDLLPLAHVRVDRDHLGRVGSKEAHRAAVPHGSERLLHRVPSAVRAVVGAIVEATGVLRHLLQLVPLAFEEADRNLDRHRLGEDQLRPLEDHVVVVEHLPTQLSKLVQDALHDARLGLLVVLVHGRAQGTLPSIREYGWARQAPPFGRRSPPRFVVP